MKTLPDKTIIKKITFAQIASLNIHYAGDEHLLNSSLMDCIYGKRYGKLIIDLRYTLIQWKKSIFFLSNIISFRGKLLYNDCIFGNTEYNQILYYFSLIGQHFINGFFSGGFLSNFKYIYFEIVKLFLGHQNTIYNIMPVNFLNMKKIDENKKSLIGVKNLRRPPNIIFIPDGERNFWISKSSIQTRIPSITIVDPVFYLPGILLPIPGSTTNNLSLSLLVFILLSISLKGFFNEIKQFFFDLNQKRLFFKYKKMFSKNFYKKKFNFKNNK